LEKDIEYTIFILENVKKNGETMSLNKFFLILLVIASQVFSAYLKNIPMEIVQPNGTKINCFASGDEFFNRLHDDNDYSIIQGDDGWYYYGVESNGEVIPGEYIAGTVDPEATGLKKRAVISKELYQKRVEIFNDYPKGKDAPTSGTIENIVIFIRFADETEQVGFGQPRSFYDNVFNKSEGPSLKHYFKEVSYDTLNVNSTYYPETIDYTYNLSYQDTYNRGYFQPYNATTNPDGYEGGDDGSERTSREHTLLERAVNAIESEIPAKLPVDGNGDGYVDNVVFLISGQPGAWASLLWPHRWSLYTRTVQINGKTVGDYNFDMTGSSTYFHTGVICHEFFHSLGSPDLYHYYDNTAPDAVGAWDVMNNTGNPPQYMGAYMKYKYGDWISDIPIISEVGEYTLNPLSNPENNVFRINSPNSFNEFFIVEYRKQEGLYETSLPGSDDGILIYRINSSYDGNADGPPDEVYVYRPNGTDSITGNLSNAQFSADLGRTEFNSNSNPTPFLYSGLEGEINIFDIGIAGETITFKYGMSVNLPLQFVASTGSGKIELNWLPPVPQDGLTVDHYVIYKDGAELTTTTELTYFDMNVVQGNIYTYKITAFYTGDQTGESQPTDTFTVNYDTPKSLPFEEDFVDRTGWTQLTKNCNGRWTSKYANTAGGAKPELFTTYEEVDSATARYITPPLSTTDVDTLEVRFKHMYDAYESGLSISVEISSNMFDWTTTEFYHEADARNIGPEEIRLFITEFPNPVYVSWTIDGNLYNVDGWSIDDVYVVGNNTSISDQTLPSTTNLIGNYPNPFNPTTDISFSLDTDSEVKINIYNENGSLVDTILNSYIKRGIHSVQWDATKHATGLYFIRMESSNYRGSLKTLLIK
jgi:M6 family metalloprotease-like protein